MSDKLFQLILIIVLVLAFTVPPIGIVLWYLEWEGIGW